MAQNAERFFDFSADVHEHRNSPRFQTSIPVSLHTFDGEARATIVDLSSGGFACRVECAIRPGSRCSVDLPIIGQRDIEVIRNEGGLLRCAFHAQVEEFTVRSILSIF